MNESREQMTARLRELEKEQMQIEINYLTFLLRQDEQKANIRAEKNKLIVSLARLNAKPAGIAKNDLSGFKPRNN